MRASTRLSLPVMALLACATSARAGSPDSFSFSHIERRFQGSGDMGEARGAITRYLPAGLPGDMARALLEQAGAHCEAAPDHLHCTYESRDPEGLWTQTATWTTDARIQDGRVAAVSVDRSWSMDYQT